MDNGRSADWVGRFVCRNVGDDLKKIRRDSVEKMVSEDWFKTVSNYVRQKLLESVELSSQITTTNTNTGTVSNKQDQEEE
mmetsp:Transcript_17450/g.49296  ORF Transcript_17450/g.49296 Transcript_17450/m.49296 type:complete len:80 (-) Transcript_17450:265-504(-)